MFFKQLRSRLCEQQGPLDSTLHSTEESRAEMWFRGLTSKKWETIVSQVEGQRGIITGSNRHNWDNIRGGIRDLLQEMEEDKDFAKKLTLKGYMDTIIQAYRFAHASSPPQTVNKGLYKQSRLDFMTRQRGTLGDSTDYEK